jgi:hypothetical protein
MTDQNQEFEDVKSAALYAAANTGLFPKSKTSLFRYVSMRGIAWELLEKTLLTNALPLSRTVDLNDPFDSNPVIVDDTIPSDISDFAKELLTLQGIPADFEKLHVVYPDERRVPKEQLEERAKQFFQTQMEARNKQCHIASFSRRISSELQWSHYAEGYKGLAYHFVTQPVEGSGFSHLRTVRYANQRPIVLLSELMDQIKSLRTSSFVQGWLSFEQRSFLTKSLEWAYEEEERILKQGVSEISFLERELVSIIIGPRFPESDVARLRTIIGKRNRPVKLFRAQSSPTSYAVEVRWDNDLYVA